ncbi:ribonuclease E/G [Hyphococcus lacteus]|uniref:Ribonuclease E/G n=1 Tax=Hyphococcus lacteus TaxID=3143536 RepID=A0ABV3Z5W2_9PROT
MNRRLIIECGVAETRAALIINGQLFKLWFGPARGDEHRYTEPRESHRFVGKVTRIDVGLNAVFVNLGNNVSGFLPLKPRYQKECNEGASIIVDVKAPSRQGKGAELRFVQTDTDKSQLGRIAPFDDPLLEVVTAIGDVDNIVVNDGRAAQALDSAGYKNVQHHSGTENLFDTEHVSAGLDGIFDRFVSLPQGGVVIIDETQALTAIDVDTGSLVASSSSRLKERTAFAAADVIFQQISIRNISGHVVIDFPSLSSDVVRSKFLKHLKSQTDWLPGLKQASFSKSGLYSFTLPRRGLSLLEQFTEASPASPIAGRPFAIEYATKIAIRTLENTLRSNPSQTITLDVGRLIFDYLTGYPEWASRLRDRYGPRFEITTSGKCEERSFECSEQR